MRKHITESETQRTRIDEALASLSETHSSMKDAALGLAGNLAAMAHTPAGDEVLKNTLANFAFEHFEMAAYKSIITMAEALSHPQGLAAARESLKEEEMMAKWIDEHIGPTTLQFMGRAQAGVKADR